MSKKLLAIYEEALERIRDMNPITPEVSKIAAEALSEGEKDAEAEKAALLITLRDFIMSNGMIFDTAEEMADKLNADGSILTIRGKTWTKASIARLMPEIRLAILAATAKVPVTVAPVAVEQIETTVMPEAMPMPTPEPIDAPVINELAELDELAQLDAVLTAA